MNLKLNSMRVGNRYAAAVFRNEDVPLGESKAVLEVRWHKDWMVRGTWGARSCVNNGTETLVSFETRTPEFCIRSDDTEMGQLFARFVLDPNAAIVEVVL